MIQFPPITRSERTVALRLAALEDNVQASQELMVNAFTQLQSNSAEHSLQRHEREIEELRRRLETIVTEQGRWQKEVLLELRAILDATAPAPVSIPPNVSIRPNRITENSEDPDAEAEMEMPVSSDPDAEAEMPEKPNPKGKRK